jgi:chorismate mutase / prephenate dehydratase
MKKVTAKDSGKRELIEKHREAIEEIDAQIVSLLAKRVSKAAETGRIKKKAGLSLVDAVREAEVLDRVASLAGNRLDGRWLRRIYVQIIEAARSVQNLPGVGFLGPVGTFTHQAATLFFKGSFSFVPCGRVRDVFSGVERKEFSWGMVPAENSWEGSVDSTLDLLERHDVNIVGEQLMPIRHQLLGKGEDLSLVTRIHSHPMALAQCSRRLFELVPHAEYKEETSTAAAAEKAAMDPGAAAVASSICCKIYGLRILAADVADDPGNTTRFLVLGMGMPKRTGADKTSIIFSLPHKPGSLHSVLTPPSERGINLTRIDSRPAKGRSWEYLFFVDLEGHMEEDTMKNTLDEMKACCTYLRVLGSYPACHHPGSPNQNQPEDQNETIVG